MAAAETYEEWAKLALEHDEATGMDRWRNREHTRLYDYEAIRERLDRLRALRIQGDDHGLLFALNEGIHGNMGGMGSAKLHGRAKSGTKKLVEAYVDEIVDALQYLAEARVGRGRRSREGRLLLSRVPLLRSHGSDALRGWDPGLRPRGGRQGALRAGRAAAGDLRERARARSSRASSGRRPTRSSPISSTRADSRKRPTKRRTSWRRPRTGRPGRSGSTASVA